MEVHRLSPTAQNLAEAIGPMRVLFWIGAGTSCPAPPRIPADSADENGLAFRLALDHYGDRELIRVNVGEGFRLSDLAAVLGKNRVRDLLLQQGWPDLEPTKAHRAMSALAAEDLNVELVTINYDPLLEKALRTIGLTPLTVCSAETVQHLRQDQLCVVKAHGCPFADGTADNLLMLDADLANAPQWLLNFLRGRLQERIFVYSGFSGNAPYVRASVADVMRALNQNMARAFAVDVRTPESVYDHDNDFGHFLRDSNVARDDYSPDGADDFFEEVANRVFRNLLLRSLDVAAQRAEQRMAVRPQDLSAIINAMSYEAIRSVVGKLIYLFPPISAPIRVQDSCVERLFKWLLLLAARNTLDASSLRPLLVSPFRPGPNSTASAPIVFFDAAENDAQECVKQKPPLLRN